MAEITAEVLYAQDPSQIPNNFGKGEAYDCLHFIQVGFDASRGFIVAEKSYLRLEEFIFSNVKYKTGFKGSLKRH